jgi:hypothetical protein
LAVRATIGWWSGAAPVARASRARNLPRRFEAVHLGHLAIHEHHVRALALDLSQCLPPIAGEEHRAPEVFQHRHGDLLVHRVVLDDQDASHERAVSGVVAAGGDRVDHGAGNVHDPGHRTVKLSAVYRLAQVLGGAGCAQRCRVAGRGDGGEHDQLDRGL